MRENLIPNPDFEQGLLGWEATPGNVSLVDAPSGRTVLLRPGKGVAAICSDPIEVLPGARYVLEVGYRLPIKCEIAVLGQSGMVAPAQDGEVVANESPVRVQVTARAGANAGISFVRMQPVGPRFKVLEVSSSYPFTAPGAPFEITCAFTNVGSAPTPSGFAHLRAEHLDLLEEHKAEQAIEALAIGEVARVGWLIGRQRRALARFEIALEAGPAKISIASTSVKHIPRPPAADSIKSVVQARGWYSVGTRGLRLTGHETDMDYSPVHVGDDMGRTTFGVLDHIAQLSVAGLDLIPLWSTLARGGPGQVELRGANDFARWTIGLRPNHRDHGIDFELKLQPRRRLDSASVVLGPLRFAPGALGSEAKPIRRPRHEEPELDWQMDDGIAEFVPPTSRSISTKPRTLMPGTTVRILATLARARKELAKS